jgi:uncharacterized protein (TIGR03437 family)
MPVAALADLSATPTVQPTGSLDLDTGSVLSYPNENYDLGWNGALHTFPPAGGYLVPGATGSAAFNALTQTSLAGFTYSTNFNLATPQLAVGAIVAIKTQTGKYAKLLVTALTPANASGSISLQFTTYGVGGSGNSVQPTVTAIANNYSPVPQGAPNWGIAPGSIFIIQGSGLAGTTTSLQSSASPGLQTSLNGVTVQVQVVNTKVLCYLYYLSPTQIDVVLPSNTPTGAGTLTVTNNGVASAGTAITVSLAAYGILSYNGTLAAAYDAGNNLITPFNAANPGQTIALWGSGLGADPSNDDHLFPQKQNNLAGANLQAFVGGVSAPIVYAGRSQYPGLDQVVLTIPASVTPGCYVSVVIVASQITPSNLATIPVAASGKSCSDAGNPIAPQQYQTLGSQTPAKVGALVLLEAVGSGGGTAAGGSFQQMSGFGATVGYGSVSIGSCIVVYSVSALSTTNSGLNAGSAITLTGPAGALTVGPYSGTGGGPGIYVAAAPSGFIPAGGGTFTFDNGGGADVGHFSASLVFPGSFTWTNQAQVTTVLQSQGLTVNWSGGAGGGFASVSGVAAATLAGTSNAGVTFTCYAPLAAGTFTVPPAVLLSMPSGSGTLTVGVLATPSAFTAPGLDFGVTTGAIGYTQTVTYGSNAKK